MKKSVWSHVTNVTQSVWWGWWMMKVLFGNTKCGDGVSVQSSVAPLPRQVARPPRASASANEHLNSLYQHDISELPSTSAEQQDALSQVCDTDISGRLSAQELASCMAIVIKSPPHDVTFQECSAFAIGLPALRQGICAFADVDGNGVISREEFASAALPQMQALMASVRSVVAAVLLKQRRAAIEKIQQVEADDASVAASSSSTTTTTAASASAATTATTSSTNTPLICSLGSQSPGPHSPCQCIHGHEPVSSDGNDKHLSQTLTCRPCPYGHFKTRDAAPSDFCVKCSDIDGRVARTLQLGSTSASDCIASPPPPPEPAAQPLPTMAVADTPDNLRESSTFKAAAANRQSFGVWRGASAANTRLCDAWILPLLNDPRALLLWMYFFDDNSALDLIDNTHIDGLSIAEFAVKWAVIPSYPLLRALFENRWFIATGVVIVSRHAHCSSPNPTPPHPLRR